MAPLAPQGWVIIFCKSVTIDHPRARHAGTQSKSEERNERCQVPGPRPVSYLSLTLIMENIQYLVSFELVNFEKTKGKDPVPYDVRPVFVALNSDEPESFFWDSNPSQIISENDRIFSNSWSQFKKKNWWESWMNLRANPSTKPLNFSRKLIIICH